MSLPPAKLHELDREEMWDVARALNPATTREQFDAQWEEFIEVKERKARQ